MRALGRLTVRFFLFIVVEALSVGLTTALLPGIELNPGPDENVLSTAVAVAIVLAIANSFVRPVLLLLTLPLSLRTVGLFTILINALMIWLTSWVLPFFHVSGFWSALLGTLLLSLLNTILSSLLLVDEDYSFYDGLVEFLSRRRTVAAPHADGRGIVLLEIDGLSDERLRHALKIGLMPNTRRLLQTGTHRLSHFDCGLPSQTSSCQAGIMYGKNDDIPAFRWFLKDEGRMVVSTDFDDAFELNMRLSDGSGLLRGGTTINNLLSGDASKSLFTLSLLNDAPETIERRNPEDLYLMLINPYLFTRSLLLSLADVLLELFQGLRQHLLDVQPRLNRLATGYYPLLRGGSNVLLREISTYAVIMDIVRGSPAIYTTFFGYDEIAHHAGPDTGDAFNSLKAIDAAIGRILTVARRKAPRPYDIFILSDHGQSAGATFKQRYGISLFDLVDELVGAGTSVAELRVTEASRAYTAAFLEEIRNLEASDAVGPVSTRTIGRARKSLQRQLGPEPPPARMDSQVVVGVSGNLAHVYFDLHGDKVTLEELNAAYPGLVDSLIAHPGIGLVVCHMDDGAPWVFGTAGGRNLLDGQVVQEDPLTMVGQNALRARQLLRLAQMEHAGDLIINSTLYPDGTVAAFEEKIGSHGGLGGQQTDAFLLHPADMDVPPTSNATDLYPLLNSRRGLPGQPLAPAANYYDAWSPRNLWDGIRMVRGWMNLLLPALFLRRRTYSEVANDARLTGPALLIAMITAVVSAALASGWPSGPAFSRQHFAFEWLLRVGSWVLLVFAMPIAARMLGGFGNGTRGFRAFAFAQLPLVLTWLRVVPVLSTAVQIVGYGWALVALWIAMQEAFRLRRLLTLLLPVLYLLLVLLTLVAGYFVVSGIALTLEMLLTRLGLG